MIFIIQKTIIYAMPLLIVALAGMIVERSGIINLALEGEMVFGAFIGAVFVWNMQMHNILADNPQCLFIYAMIVSGFAGAVFSLLLSFSAIHLKANQAIAGVSMNMLAPAFVNTMALAFFNREKVVMPKAMNFVMIDESATGITKIFFDKAYISTYVIILLYILLSIWLYKTKMGLRIRACGENPHAADSVGINVFFMRYFATTLSGALAGLGGYVYIVTTAGGTAESTVSGIGFLALAIMIFGNWEPVGIFFGSILFGFLRSIGSISGVIPFLDRLKLPMYFYNLIPYVVVLVFLIFTAQKSNCPKSEGIPYDKNI